MLTTINLFKSFMNAQKLQNILEFDILAEVNKLFYRLLSLNISLNQEET